MRKLVILNGADADLRGIFRYTANRWSLDQAEHYAKQFYDAFDDIADGRQRGRDAGDLREGLRRHQCGSHVIFFRLTSTNGLEIVRILHQRMDFDTRLANEP